MYFNYKGENREIAHGISSYSFFIDIFIFPHVDFLSSACNQCISGILQFA